MDIFIFKNYEIDVLAYRILKSQQGNIDQDFPHFSRNLCNGNHIFLRRQLQADSKMDLIDSYGYKRL